MRRRPDTAREPYQHSEIVQARMVAWVIRAAVAALILFAARWAGVSWHDIGVVASWCAVAVVAYYIIMDVRNDSEWQQ